MLCEHRCFSCYSGCCFNTFMFPQRVTATDYYSSFIFKVKTTQFFNGAEDSVLSHSEPTLWLSVIRNCWGVTQESSSSLSTLNHHWDAVLLKQCTWHHSCGVLVNTEQASCDSYHLWRERSTCSGGCSSERGRECKDQVKILRLTNCLLTKKTKLVFSPSRESVVTFLFYIVNKDKALLGLTHNTKILMYANVP